MPKSDKMSNVYSRGKEYATGTGSKEIPYSNNNSVATVKNVKEVNVLIGLLTFRLCNVVLVQTWFVPDEYWQGPEVAHRMVFGYGYKTWEWKEGIRGYTFPLMFAILFKCLQFFRVDWPLLIIYFPRIFQAILSAVGEFHIYKFAKLKCGPKAAWWVLFCLVTSWFLFFCSTRTLTNTMETSFVSVGLYYWELNQSNSLESIKHFSLYKGLTFASLSCLVRPTALIMWIPLGISKLYHSPSWTNFIFKYILPVGVSAVLFSIGLDSLFYKKFLLVQYNFLYFNIMQNIGMIYGTHPWHWYLTQGIPVVLTSHLVPLLIGLYYSSKYFSKWILLIVINIATYSFLSHKEFRFILPIIPLLMCICGEGLHKMADTCILTGSNKKDDDNSNGVGEKQNMTKDKMLAMFLILTNVPIAIYTGLVHQRGTLDVMKALGNQLHNHNNDNFNVLFLMPCHSTPYYSVCKTYHSCDDNVCAISKHATKKLHITYDGINGVTFVCLYVHRNIKMTFLDCCPSTNAGYVDEADQFYKNPIEWLNNRYKTTQSYLSLPTHIVIFDVLLNDINDFLYKHKYKKCGEFFYSHFPSGRIGWQVLLFCKNDVFKS